MSRSIVVPERCAPKTKKGGLRLTSLTVMAQIGGSTLLLDRRTKRLSLIRSLQIRTDHDRTLLAISGHQDPRFVATNRSDFRGELRQRWIVGVTVILRNQPHSKVLGGELSDRHPASMRRLAIEI